MASSSVNGSFKEPYKLIDETSLYLRAPRKELVELASSLPELFKSARLSFSGNKEVDEEVIALWQKKCPHLKILDLSAIPAIHMDRLPTTQELTTLDLSSTTIDIAELRAFLARQQTLESLTLDHVLLSAEEIQAIFEGASKRLVCFSNRYNTQLVARDWSLIQERLVSMGISSSLSY